MRPEALAAILAALALAGCAGGDPAGPDDPSAAGPGAAGEDDAAGPVLAPTWQVGDAWTLQSPNQDTPFTHVVSGDAGDDWVVDTDSPATAYFDARFDISFLGKVRKSDLAGSQGSMRVEFLKFPLATGLEWTTTWDGAPIRVTAVEVADGKATLEAYRGDGTLYAKYTYDARPGYFTRFAFYGPDGKEVGFEWTLQQASKGHSGPLVRWQLQELLAVTGPIPQGFNGMFTVQAGFTDVWIDGVLDCQSGAVVLAVGPLTGPAEDRGYSNAGPCPLADVSAYAVTAPGTAEQWGALLSSSPATVGTLDLLVFGRVLTEFTAGQAP